MNLEMMVIPAVLALVAGILATCSRITGLRSRKLGLMALAYGALALIAVFSASHFREYAKVQLLFLCGVAAFFFAILALLLGLLGLRAKGGEGGKGRAWPICGLVSGVVNLVLGLWIFAVGIGILTSENGTPWVWKSDQHGFELTVPSEKWILRPDKNGLANFSSSQPEVVAGVAKILPAETDGQYQSALGLGWLMKKGKPTTNTDERTGTNRHGHPYMLYMGDTTKNGTYFVGFSITRVRDKAILMLAEGYYRKMSEPEKEREAQTIRSQVELFLESVK